MILRHRDLGPTAPRHAQRGDLTVASTSAQHPLWLTVNVALAWVLAATSFDGAWRADAGSWVLAIVVITLFQLYLWWKICDHGNATSGAARRAMIGAGTLGVAWALATIGIDPPGGSVTHSPLPFVLVGLSIAALPFLAGHLGAYVVFLACVLVPLALRLALEGSPMLATLALVYLVGLIQLARHLNARLVTAGRGVAESRDLRAMLDRQSTLLAATFDQADRGIAVFDRDLRLVSWNPRHRELHDYPDELYRPGTRLDAFVRDDLARSGSLPIDRERAQTCRPAPAPARFELPASDHRILEVERRRLAAGGVISTSTDITARKEVEARMLHLAQHDPLTGLPNRLLFDDRLRHALARCRRDRTDLAVMLLDLDNFKPINDALGHRVGDRILEVVARRLRAGLRESDTVARIGGDEFALILPVLPHTEAAAVVARKVLARLDAPVEIDGRPVALRASLGLATFPQDGERAELLLHHADLAMYRAKAAGGGFRPFAPRVQRSFDHRPSLERELQHAIARNQLRLLYQPLLDLRAQRISGVEALLRWHHPELGDIAPEILVRAAEDSGQASRLGEWVLTQACAAAGALCDDGGPVRVAVNVSRAQLRDPGLVRSVDRILKQTGCPARLLELELTETVPIAEIGEVAPTIERLHELGVGLALDDFGVGEAALAHLRQLPLDTLKLDRSLVVGLEQTVDAAITGSLIDLGHRLRLRVVAEGVETPAQLAILRRMGCDEVQGHIVGPPCTQTEAIAHQSPAPAARAAG